MINIQKWFFHLVHHNEKENKNIGGDVFIILGFISLYYQYVFFKHNEIKRITCYGLQMFQFFYFKILKLNAKWFHENL